MERRSSPDFPTAVFLRWTGSPASIWRKVILHESLDRWKHSLHILKTEVLETKNVQVLFIYLFYSNHDQMTNKKITCTHTKTLKKTFNCSIYTDLTLVVGWGGKGVGIQLSSIWTLLSAAIQRMQRETNTVGNFS